MDKPSRAFAAGYSPRGRCRSRNRPARAFSPADLVACLARAGFPLYARGSRLIGVSCGNRCFRFRSLGMAEALARAEERWQRMPARPSQLHALALAVARQFCRTFGYAAAMLAVLASGQEPPAAGAGARRTIPGAAARMSAATIRMAMAAMADRAAKLGEIARGLGITSTTLYDYVNGDGAPQAAAQRILATG